MTVKNRFIQLRYDLNQVASFILKVALGVALGILIAAPLVSG